MSDSTLGAGGWWPVASEKKSTRDHLLNTAKQCLDDRKKYIEKLGNAEGKEVFKYLLLLNYIECESYVNEIQLQAHTIFGWSTGIAVVAFFLVAVSVFAALTSQLFMNGQGLQVIYVSGISGVITSFISGIFFYLYNRSLKRLEEFHTQLRNVQKIAISLFLSGLMQNSSQSDKEMKGMIDQLMSTMNADATNRNGNIKTSALRGA